MGLFFAMICCTLSAIVGYVCGAKDSNKPMLNKKKKVEEKRTTFSQLKTRLYHAKVTAHCYGTTRPTENESYNGFYIARVPDVKSIEEYGYYLLKVFGFPIITIVELEDEGRTKKIRFHDEKERESFFISLDYRGEAEKDEALEQFFRELFVFFEQYVKVGCPITHMKLDSEVEIIVARAKGVDIDPQNYNARRYGIARGDI